MGEAHRADRQRKGRNDLQARKCGSAEGLVTDGYEHRGQQIFPRQARNSGARKLRAAIDRPGGEHGSALGEEGGYFANEASRDAFRDELTHLLVEQKMAFNSPVWFNVGVQPKPQCSACFINSVQDNMESIMGLTRTEGMLFKWGSGTGTNFSSLRGSKETLSGGGIASGPVSFMKGFDAFAGVIKSGGKTRRAAKMVILNIDHPD